MTDRRALLAGIAGGAVAGASNLTAGVAKRKGRHGSGGAGKPKPGKPDQRPNVVLIIADDMRSRDWIALNRTRELLNDGVWFENFIINNPMCSPSRTTLLTGQCSHNHGVVRNVGDDDEAGFDAYQSLRLDDVALAPLLQESGYQTAMIGKFINGYELGMRQPAGWTRWVGRETLDYTNYDLQVDRDRVSFRGERQYITDVLRDYACDFIRSAAPELPLYLYLSMAAPHAPNEPARRHRDLYPGAVVERDLSFNEADTSDKPSRVANVGPLAPEQIVALDSTNRRRLQSLAALDEAIVRVVETLDATGRLENTSIFVMSDNGLMMGQHRLFCAKGVPYDQAIRIPLLAWGPGFKGKSTVRLASNIDIAPTIAELAGVRFDTADGKSLIRNTARDYVLLQTSPHSLTFGGFGLRSSQLMYFEQASGESEYYDLRTDPLETNNLLPPSGPPGHIPMDLPRPEELSARLATLKVCAGGNCA